MTRMFLLACAFLAFTAPSPSPSVVRHLDEVVATWHHDAWLDAPTAFVLAPLDFAVPATPNLVPPTPIGDDEDPHASACVAGERPIVVRHFARGGKAYVATC